MAAAFEPLGFRYPSNDESFYYDTASSGNAAWRRRYGTVEAFSGSSSSSMQHAATPQSDGLPDTTRLLCILLDERRRFVYLLMGLVGFEALLIFVLFQRLVR
jgi:hypothetical protein